MATHECDECEGTGICKDRFHDTSGPFEVLSAMVSDAASVGCPTCDGGSAHPGECPHCRGTGRRYS